MLKCIGRVCCENFDTVTDLMAVFSFERLETSHFVHRWTDCRGTAGQILFVLYFLLTEVPCQSVT
jgi:hypothetical protein